MEVFDRGVHVEEIFPDEEHEFQDGSELDCLVLASELGLFVGPEAQVQDQLYQVVDVLGLVFGGVLSYSHNGVKDSQGDSFFPLDWGVLDLIGFKLSDEALVNTGVSL